MRAIHFLGIAMLSAAIIGCQTHPALAPGSAAPQPPASSSAVLAASTAADWREVPPEQLLVMTLAGGGRVLMELAPEFAPLHADNIRQLARSGYYDGLAILRVQDNYVVQWGDPNEQQPRSVGAAQRTLPGEFSRPIAGLAEFTPLPDGDVYAAQVGHSGGFAAARDPARGQAWLAHCYGALGVGRGMGADSGGGPELYVVIGHAPRHLDRNITLAGRVLQGMDQLTALPRGTGPLGFYEKPDQYVTIASIRVAADLPTSERPALQVLRTNTPLWAAYVDTRRNRRDPWFIEATGHVDLCNVGVPVRETPRG